MHLLELRSIAMRPDLLHVLDVPMAHSWTALHPPAVLGREPGCAQEPLHPRADPFLVSFATLTYGQKFLQKLESMLLRGTFYPQASHTPDRFVSYRARATKMDGYLKFVEAGLQTSHRSGNLPDLQRLLLTH